MCSQINERLLHSNVKVAIEKYSKWLVFVAYLFLYLLEMLFYLVKVVLPPEKAFDD